MDVEDFFLSSSFAFLFALCTIFGFKIALYCTQFTFPTLTSYLNLFSYSCWTKLKGFTFFKHTKNLVKRLENLFV